MVIKLKDISRNTVVKFVVFLFSMGVLTLAVTQLVDIVVLGVNPVYLFMDEYPGDSFGQVYLNGKETKSQIVLQEEWKEKRQELIDISIPIGCNVGMGILCIAFLTFVSGKKPGDELIHMRWTDRIYTELAFGICIFIAICGVIFLLEITRNMLGAKAYEINLFNVILVMSSTAAYTFASVFYYSLVRRIKARTIYSSSGIGHIIRAFKAMCRYVVTAVKTFLEGRLFKADSYTKTLQKMQIAFIAAAIFTAYICLFFAVLVRNSFFCLVSVLLYAGAIYLYWKGSSRVYDKIDEGFDSSLKEQMRAERMKIDLVTNVSHDLKTPLTSIISYVELLAKEQGLSDTSREYVTILADKSERLKHIVSDLFELAKVTSGDSTLELEDIDLKKLAEQTLADMADKIDASPCEMRVKLAPDAVLTRADGKKMYRVMQNILDNALKYSLPGTRIYLDVMHSGEKGAIVLRNTSAYEMEFTPEEVQMRFLRGDKSRSTDGSGLGISIAQTFTESCGGEFKIDIDGDMFKVSLEFRTVTI